MREIHRQHPVILGAMVSQARKPRLLHQLLLAPEVRARGLAAQAILRPDSAAQANNSFRSLNRRCAILTIFQAAVCSMIEIVGGKRPDDDSNVSRKPNSRTPHAARRIRQPLWASVVVLLGLGGHPNPAIEGQLKTGHRE